jgi:hypothetical protein
MGFYCKIYRSGKEKIVVACDEKIYGKKFKEGEAVLNVEKKFYGKEIKEEREVLALLSDATIINVVGEEIISLAIKEGIIDARNVLKIKGIPHAQMVKT